MKTILEYVFLGMRLRGVLFFAGKQVSELSVGESEHFAMWDVKQ